MWDVHNLTSFVIERTISVDVTGARHYVVAIKGTFHVEHDGSLALLEEQPPIAVGPEFLGEDGASSLRHDGELTASKRRTDLLVCGHAYAPGGRPTTEVTVGLQTPRGTKALRVRGDRRWERNAVGLVEPTPPEPFIEIPITYERTFGGFDQSDPDPASHRLFDANPIGVGFYTSRAHRVGDRLPNIEPVDDPGAPAGFGAIPSHWQPRRALWGTYDAKWLEERKPLLPPDFDPLALQSAPVDQQFEPHLRGGETIGLVNMDPTGRMAFAVPKRYFGLSTFTGRVKLDHRAKLSTILVEPDDRIVRAIWLSDLACGRRIDDIDYTEIVEKRLVE